MKVALIDVTDVGSLVGHTWSICSVYLNFVQENCLGRFFSVYSLSLLEFSISELDPRSGSNC